MLITIETVYVYIPTIFILGTFFLIWGLWWTFTSFWTYLCLSKRNKSSSRGRTRQPLSSFLYEDDDYLSKQSWLTKPCCTKVPLEPLVKVILPGLGVMSAMFLHVDRQWKFVPFVYTVHMVDGHMTTLGRMYHITMYSAFVFAGIVDLVSYYLKLPRHTSQFFTSFAFFSEALLFHYHVHGRDSFNTTIHNILVVIATFCATCSFLRMLNPRNLLLNTCVAGGMLMQGTWFFQAGFILYGKYSVWKWQSPSLVHFTAILAVWHFLTVSAFLVTIFLIMRTGTVLARRMNNHNFLEGTPTRNGLQEKEPLIAAHSGTTADGNVMEMHSLEEPMV